METLQEMKKRIASFSYDSLYRRVDGCLETRASLVSKVSDTGEMKPYYGNSMIFEMTDESALKYCECLCQMLAGSDMMAEALRKETMHMTLHDLVNGPELEPLQEKLKEVDEQVREQLYALQDFTIYMKPSRVYSMMNTSIVMGLEACDETSHKQLMELYKTFETVYPLSYPLTPHVTLGYFKPGVYASGSVWELEERIRRCNDLLKDELVITFTKNDLKLLYFNDMNHYFEEE